MMFFLRWRKGTSPLGMHNFHTEQGDFWEGRAKTPNFLSLRFAIKETYFGGS